MFRRRDIQYVVSEWDIYIIGFCLNSTLSKDIRNILLHIYKFNYRNKELKISTFCVKIYEGIR